MFRHRTLQPLADRGPLRVMFLLTSMPVGGAETLLVNLIRRLDRNRFAPELCCLKSLDVLGEEMAQEVPTFSGFIANKFDVRVLGRLTRLFRERRVDAVITVAAGDKMFWGRLAAWRAGVPVIASALHSTGWPDGIGRLNRWLTPITDAFIGVAAPHVEHLVQVEGFPENKVRLIPNGVDVQRFCPRGDCPNFARGGHAPSNEVSEQDGTVPFSAAAPFSPLALRASLGIPATAPLVGIVAALRPEKNHELFLRVAAAVRRQIPQAHFLIVGDGPQRAKLEELTRSHHLEDAVHFVGTRPDVPELLSLVDVFLLTSHMEANPVSILEALASAKPVVSTRVGSVGEAVLEQITGYLAEPGNAKELAAHVVKLLSNPQLAGEMGRAGRAHVIDSWSLERMVEGYQDLITEIYESKCRRVSGVPGGRGSRRAAALETTDFSPQRGAEDAEPTSPY
jgi:glycosyltransferase involved in cell wall biosynthesis